MPNHIQNKLTFAGSADAVAVLRDAIKADEDGKTYPIGFEKIIPPPIQMQARSVPVAVEGVAEYIMDPGDPRKRFYWDSSIARGSGPATYSDENWELFIEYLQNLRGTGHATLMSWSRENWNTKWNAYDMPNMRDTETEIHFQTAWSAPHPVIEALSRQHPGVQITHEWADEDIGHNAGRRIYRNGEVVGDWDIGNGSDEARAFAYELHGREPIELD